MLINFSRNWEFEMGMMEIEWSTEPSLHSLYFTTLKNGPTVIHFRLLKCISDQIHDSSPARTKWRTKIWSTNVIDNNYYKIHLKKKKKKRTIGDVHCLPHYTNLVCYCIFSLLIISIFWWCPDSENEGTEQTER